MFYRGNEKTGCLPCLEPRVTCQASHEWHFLLSFSDPQTLLPRCLRHFSSFIEISRQPLLPSGLNHILKGLNCYDKRRMFRYCALQLKICQIRNCVFYNLQIKEALHQSSKSMAIFSQPLLNLDCFGLSHIGFTESA